MVKCSVRWKNSFTDKLLYFFEIDSVEHPKCHPFFERKMLVDDLMLQKKDKNGTGVERLVNIKTL